MDRVTAAFGYPFGKGWLQAWLVGVPLLLLPPLGFIPLLGYSVAVVRASAKDPDAGLPPWRPLGRLLGDGCRLALVLAVLTAPFALLAAGLAPAADRALTAVVQDPFLRPAFSDVLAASVAALPWGILLLVLMPPATSRFASSGSVASLFDVSASLRLVRSRFVTWNLVVVAIVTAWAIGLAGLGLALIGVIPGVFYAILVSARATAVLADA